MEAGNSLLRLSLKLSPGKFTENRFTKIESKIRLSTYFRQNSGIRVLTTREIRKINLLRSGTETATHREHFQNKNGF